MLNYQYNEDWIGGTYYIQNLIHALNTLSDNEKPILFINSENEKAVEQLKELTSYPYLNGFGFYKLNLFQRGVNFLSRKFFKKIYFKTFPNYDVAFPALHADKKCLQKQIFWIPDFQEKYLPHFFSEEDIVSRDSFYNFIKEKSHHLIFSSIDAQKDFNTFYSQGFPKQYVLNFATFHNNKNLPCKEDVFKKFSIEGDYFLCSNQFWIHKNHIVVLKAIALLKKEGKNITVVFTGKEKDYRNPDYFSDLKEQVGVLGIANNVKFLGFIDRDDQIVLLKNCKSIIQPSLFEGWSTVNEDAKAENVFILAGNLNVNIEQLQNYPNYSLFDPNDEKSLSVELKKEMFVIKDADYSQNVKSFGKEFMNIVQNIILKNK